MSQRYGMNFCERHREREQEKERERGDTEIEETVIFHFMKDDFFQGRHYGYLFRHYYSTYVY